VKGGTGRWAGGGGYVLAAADGFRLVGADGTPGGAPLRPPGMAAGVRFNDGACDPSGRFWAGTVARDRRPGAGALYRLDPDGQITVVLDGVTESNGLGWSPDGGTFYFIDSGEPRPRIRAFPCDLAAGTLGAPRDLVQPPPEQGIPDGLIVDAAGCVWVAFWGGHAVRRYSPAGELLAELPVPVSQPSCPALGGPDLADLYVTTAWEDMAPAQRAAEPLAGHLLRTRVDRAGLEGAGLEGAVGQPAGTVRRIGRHSVEDRARGHHQAVPGWDHRGPVAGPVHRGRRAHGAGRAVRLREDHGAAHGGRPGGDHRGHHPDRRPAGQRHGARDRDIAMVFQSYALYPHLTVRDNMGFSLKYRKTPKQEIRRRVDETARILELGELLGRKPRQLSGRAAAAGRDGPGHRPPAPRVPDGRAAVQPGRQAPGGRCGLRSPGCSARSG